MSGAVRPALRALLRPHLDDLHDKMVPGMLVLTWTSMNIDGYLHRFHQARPVCSNSCAASMPLALRCWADPSMCAPPPNTRTRSSPQCLARTEELARTTGDIMGSRIEANLAAVRAARLLDLPDDQTFTYEAFVAAQVRRRLRRRLSPGCQPCAPARPARLRTGAGQPA